MRAVRATAHSEKRNQVMPYSFDSPCQCFPVFYEKLERGG